MQSLEALLLSFVLLGLFACMAVAQPRVPGLPEVGSHLRFPQHPYLLIDSQQIDRGRRLIVQKPWARALLQEMEDRAEAALAGCLDFAALPGKDDGRHVTIARGSLDAALAYAFSGDERYAFVVRKVLSKYAEAYPNMQVAGTFNQGTRCFSSALSEAIWFIPLVQAYDLVWNSPDFSREDKDRFEKYVVRLTVPGLIVLDPKNDPRWTNNSFRCGNHSAYHTIAAGLAALCLQDRELFDTVVRGFFGFAHAIGHDLRGDGFHCERSPGYHVSVAADMAELAEAAHHCGVELYGYEAPSTAWTETSEWNYPVAGDTAPRTLRDMYDVLFHLAFPDMSFPAIADGGTNEGRQQFRSYLSVPWLRLWNRYRDPRYAWAAQREMSQSPANWRGPDDLSAQVHLGYDDSHLYVKAVVSDDSLRSLDGLWLGVTIGEAGADYEALYLLTPSSKGTASIELRRQRGRFVGHASKGTGFSETGEGWYRLTASLPWREMTPETRVGAGTELRLELCLQDNDDRWNRPVVQKRMGWHSEENWRDPMEGARAVLGQSSDRRKRFDLVIPRLSLSLKPDKEIGIPNQSKPAVLGTEGSHVLPWDSKLYPLLVYDLPASGQAAFPAGDSSFGSTGIYRSNCSLLASSGVAVLRGATPKGAKPHQPAVSPWPEDATAAALYWGPQGGSHGHADKLNLVLYGLSQQIVVDTQSAAYETPLKGRWSVQTLAHNTMVVDGHSMFPAVKPEMWWCGEGSGGNPNEKRRAVGDRLAFAAGPHLKMVRASYDAGYEGVHLDRTLFLIGPALFDIFRTTSAENHVYDYMLHLDTLPVKDLAWPLRETPLGDTWGYQYLKDLRWAELPAWSADWPLKRGDLRVSFLPVERSLTTFVTGTAPLWAEDLRRPFVLARRSGKRATFVTIMEPHLGQPTVREAGVEPLKAAPASGGFAVTWGGGQHALISCERPGPWEWRSLRANGEGACVSLKPSGWQVTVVNASTVQMGSVNMTFQPGASIDLSLRGRELALANLDDGVVVARLGTGMEAWVTPDGAKSVRLMKGKSVKVWRKD